MTEVSLEEQEHTEDDYEIIRQTKSFMSENLPNGSLFISLLYVPGGDTGRKVMLVTDIKNDGLIAAGLIEAVKAVMKFGIRYEEVEENDNGETQPSKKELH